MKIVFLGTPKIAVKSLDYLIKKEDVEVVAVVTQPDKPSGRGQKVCTTPVCCLAQDNNIPVYQPTSIKKDHELINTLKALEPDFFVTFAFGQILSQEVIDIPKYGCVNLHASLLPKYRGANPIQAALLNGDKVTGITTMMTELALDAGPIVLQQEITLTEDMETPDLCQIIGDTSPEFIYKSLKGLYDGSITPALQDADQATFTPKLKKEDGEIDWSQPAEVIHNKVRGLRPWPGAFTCIKGACFKISRTMLNHEENVNSNKPGEIIGKIKEGIKVSTGKGTIILTKVQPANKKEQDAISWYNGARLKEGECFSTTQSI